MSVNETFSAFKGGVESRTAGTMPVFGRRAPSSGRALNISAQQTEAPNFKDHLDSQPRAAGLPSAPSSVNLYKPTGKTAAHPPSLQLEGTRDTERLENKVQKDVWYSPERQEKQAKEKDGFSFWDFIDIINPLQHIPIVGSIYRAITGDEIGNSARIAGGALFGGPIGLAMGAANAVIENKTGKDAGELVFAKIFNKKAQPDNTAIRIAQGQSHDLNLPQQARIAQIIWQEQPERGASPSNTQARSQNIASVPVTQDIELDHSPFSKPSDKPESVLAQSAAANLSPELFAQNMMSALDKYTEMKRENMGYKALPN